MIDKTKWKNIEKNIWQNIENPKKFMLILYYGRDARGRMKKSSKTMYVSNFIYFLALVTVICYRAKCLF